MKKQYALLLAISWLLGAGLRAQPFDNPHVYGGLGFSIPIGGVLEGTFVLPSGWGASVSASLASLKAKNKPSDYEAGENIFTIFSSGNVIYDDVTAYSFRALKLFATNKKMIRFGLEAGPSLVKTKIAENFVPNPDPCDLFGCGPNYYYEQVTSQSMGVSLKGRAEFPFTVPFGLAVGLVTNINSQRSYFGIEGQILLGYVRDRR